ncbi:MAG: hypothetical protein EOO69_10720 [Moraxellaceae bacterium]|nr:MAG: hypothetical protein EOO69_10720 [Moraxellaceae bacterium]
MLKPILILLPVLLLLSACKMVNTTIVKAIASPQISDTEARIATTTGTLYLSMQHATEQQRSILANLKPHECLHVTSAEPFKVVNSATRFNEYKLQKLMASDAKCRKISPRKGLRISMH